MTTSESRKIALITGSTDGLGRAVARGLAASGFLVLIHGRDAQRGEALVREICAQGGAARFHRADFASLGEVRALADAVRRDHDHLHLLINNAGIGTGDGGRPAPRQTSADGYELRFAVNYLAGYLLTRLLLPMLVRSAPARIVNVASAGQYPLDFDNLMLTRAYSGMRAYAQSKLAQVMFTFDLAAQLRGGGVTVNCLHPATYMNTTMVRAAGVEPTSSVEEGAAAVTNLALSRELEGHTGEYFDGLRAARANAQAYDAQARRRLAALSARLTGLDQHPGPAT
ncbi:MAG: SDR family NAD(P)-dependent oxidoreductase [Gammaproteobacteria bacterium]|nr:SDR family NAD(P)-dependent oxidoreductase [Gammaproteobacteria bacterium]